MLAWKKTVISREREREWLVVSPFEMVFVGDYSVIDSVEDSSDGGGVDVLARHSDGKRLSNVGVVNRMLSDELGNVELIIRRSNRAVCDGCGLNHYRLVNEWCIEKDCVLDRGVFRGFYVGVCVV